MKRMGGAALLLVLWIILLLSGLVAGYALNARVESLQGNGLARVVVAREAARAGVEYAVMRMLMPDPAARLQPDGRDTVFEFGGTQINLRVRDEAAYIDLNAAPFELLQGLFIALGQPREAAAKLAGAVIDWRDPDGLSQPAGGAEDPDYAAAGLPWGAKDVAFESTSELSQVLGLSPQLVAAALPHLTVDSGQAQPNAALADAVVRRAMGLPDENLPATAGAPAISGSGTYRIDSLARLADGRSVRLVAVVRMGGSGLPGSTYTTLRWQMQGAER